MRGSRRSGAIFPFFGRIFVEDTIHREEGSEGGGGGGAIKGGQLFIADEQGALEKCKGARVSLTLRWPSEFDKSGMPFGKHRRAEGRQRKEETRFDALCPALPLS